MASLPSPSQPDEKGQINSLSTVLGQEMDRFNNLLRVLKVSPCNGQPSLTAVTTGIKEGLQWNPSIVNTLWTWQSVLYREVSSFQG